MSGPGGAPIHLTYLSGPDVARLALTDDEILAAVEGALVAQGNGASCAATWRPSGWPA
jgi:hypothetical protein